MSIQLYLFFAIGAFWSSFVLSLLFLFTTVSKIQQLENYKSAKRMMAFAYLLFCIISLYEIIVTYHHFVDSSKFLRRIITSFTNPIGFGPSKEGHISRDH